MYVALCLLDHWVELCILFTFIDDATRKVWVYPIKGKGDEYPIFRKCLALVETKKRIKLKSLRCHIYLRARVGLR